MAIDPCINLKDKLDRGVSGLEDIENKATGKISALENEIESYGGSTTDPSDLAEKVKDMTPDVIGAGQEAKEKAGEFAGSCLDDVISEAAAWASRAADEVKNVVDEASSMFDVEERSLSKDLQELMAELGGFNLPDIISELDRILGCLADQPDIQGCTDDLQDYIDRINTSTSNMYLTDAGVFDDKNFLDSVPSVGEQVKENIKTITDKMGEVKDTAVENVQDLVERAKTKVDFDLF